MKALRKGTLHIEEDNLNNRRDQKEVAQFSNTERTVSIDYMMKISFRIEGETKTYSYEGKLRKFVIYRPMLR